VLSLVNVPHGYLVR